MALTASQLRRLRKSPVRINRLKVARQIAGITQTELAAALHVDQPDISRYENTRGDRTTVGVARKYAEFFGCDINDLVPSREAVAS